MTWSVAVFSSREDPATLLATVDSIAAAALRRPDVTTRIHVVVNGNRALAERMAAPLQQRADVAIRVWFVQLGDKAHAWNEFVHRIWDGTDLTYFVDGYAQINADALDLIDRALAANPHALAGSGAASAGLSASKMRATVQREGGIYGNLYVLRRGVMEWIRANGFRLPLGIYRTDPLLGAVINFNLNPAANDWDPKRILVEFGASWKQDTLKFWRLQDLMTHYRRALRQAQGTLESQAIRQHLAVERRAPAELPRTAADLVRDWMQAHPSQARRTFLRYPLSFTAARRLMAPRDWSAADVQPELITGA